MHVLNVSSPSRSLFLDSLCRRTAVSSSRIAAIMSTFMRTPDNEAGWSIALEMVSSEPGL